MTELPVAKNCKLILKEMQLTQGYVICYCNTSVSHSHQLLRDLSSSLLIICKLFNDTVRKSADSIASDSWIIPDEFFGRDVRESRHDLIYSNNSKLAGSDSEKPPNPSVTLADLAAQIRKRPSPG